ncbi:MAG: MoxR family ATPase [bacterium]|nr:MoxR family ATPase [bacterium]
MKEEVIFKERTNLDEIRDAIEKITGELRKVIVGQQEMIELVTAAILARGHIMLEGVPGIAKTLTAKLVAKTMKIGFSRIQFTPDLMPSDIIGTTVYNAKTSEFEFNKGPIFSNLILIDEINRAPAKTQAALLEVMEERQVTVDGTTYRMDEPFMVIATQNPIEYEGTYRLPEAELDRFMLKIEIDYPGFEDEVEILSQWNKRTDTEPGKEVRPVIGAQEIAQYQATVRSVLVNENLLRYIAEIVNRTRKNSSLYLGGSPRASLSILDGAKALAVLRGRDFVIPEDIQVTAYPALRHRILLTPEKEMEGTGVEDIIKEIIERIEVPR